MELLTEVSVDSDALAAMLAAMAPREPKDGLVDPDDVPEPPDEPITKPGDLWSSASTTSCVVMPAARPTSTGYWTG